MFYKGNLRCPDQFYKKYSRHRPIQMTEPESSFHLGLCQNIKNDVWYINQAMGKTPCPNLLKQCATRPEKKDEKLITAQEKLQSLSCARWSATYPRYANKRPQKRPINKQLQLCFH